jgi:hypothetical protein
MWLVDLGATPLETSTMLLVDLGVTPLETSISGNAAAHPPAAALAAALALVLVEERYAAVILVVTIALGKYASKNILFLYPSPAKILTRCASKNIESVMNI